MYPASHVLGAAQILLEAKGRRWLYTGDFRLAEDSSCDAFEPIKPMYCYGIYIRVTHISLEK